MSPYMAAAALVNIPSLSMMSTRVEPPVKDPVVRMTPVTSIDSVFSTMESSTTGMLQSNDAPDAEPAGNVNVQTVGLKSAPAAKYII